MNTTKSWFQKARAQTLRTNRHAQENRPSSDTGNTTRDAGHPNDRNGRSDPITAPTVEKTLTEFLYKPAAVRGLPVMIPEVVNAYNLDWWELEPFLEQIYPGVTFKENVSVRRGPDPPRNNESVPNANKWCCFSWLWKTII